VGVSEKGGSKSRGQGGKREGSKSREEEEGGTKVTDIQGKKDGELNPARET